MTKTAKSEVSSKPVEGSVRTSVVISDEN